NGATDACTAMGGGETEDYVITIAAAVPCSGMPDPVSVSAPSIICPSTPFTLTAVGASVGLDLEYQWEESTDGGVTWTPIAGATSISYAVSGITIPTDYRFITTCMNGGDQDISGSVTIDLEPFYNCYCPSFAQYTGDGEISNVTVGAISNSSTCAQTGGPGSIINQYSDYTTVVSPIQLTQLSSYPLSVTASSCGGSYSAWVKVWVDFNQDGMFDDSPGSDELVLSGTTPSGN